jgi:ribosomal protein S18 acetylase RimI-like enzyme
MDKAVEWTKEKKLKGIMLETQDTNLAACRFYKKYGFILGGVDTMLYGNFENKDQKALFWYYPVDIKKDNAKSA